MEIRIRSYEQREVTETQSINHKQHRTWDLYASAKVAITYRHRKMKSSRQILLSVAIAVLAKENSSQTRRQNEVAK